MFTLYFFHTVSEKENHVKEMMEQKFSQIDGITGSVEDNSGKVKENHG